MNEYGCIASDVDAVAVVTPVWTHYEIAKAALENGKHVFVEKPFTCTTAQAEELIDLADRKNLKIMVDHTFLFTGAVKRIRELIEDGTLGDLYYYDSTRVSSTTKSHSMTEPLACGSCGCSRQLTDLFARKAG